MGQYYKFVNVDRKEYFSPWDFDSGAKLMEFSYTLCDVTIFFDYLLSERWKENHIVICGDYADHTDTYAYNLSREILNNPTPEIELFIKTYTKDQLEYLNRGCNDTIYTEDDIIEDINLYQLSNCFTNVSSISIPDDFKISYYYNLNTMEFIDKSHLPLAWHFTDDNGAIKTNHISPISLLLAQGNGKGGGDYFTKDNMNLVGSWTKDSNKIIVSKTPLENHADFTEFSPEFYEREYIPYTEIEKYISVA